MSFHFYITHLNIHCLFTRLFILSDKKKMKNDEKIDETEIKCFACVMRL